jgi:hypothetical protein
MSGLTGSPWKVHRADPTDLRWALPTTRTFDDEKFQAIVITRIQLRAGDNQDILEALGLIPTAPTSHYTQYGAPKQLRRNK